MVEEFNDKDFKEAQETGSTGIYSDYDEKMNVFKFLNNIAIEDDTTKVGYLKEEELGVPSHTVRTYKELSHVGDKIIGNDFVKAYWQEKSEIITSTSLSREGFLAKLAVLQKREIADVTKPRKENKGWFKKKDKSADALETS